jgi:hypothetical protein
MIAAALNYWGVESDENFAPRFVEQFKDFKVIRLNPVEEVKPGQLQLCQPENYDQMMQQIQINWDPSETFLEIRGSRVKLQRTVRQRLFFDEQRLEKILLEGLDGLVDFPWAVQILLVRLPVEGKKQYLKQLKKMDVLILLASSEEEGQGFIDSAKKVNLDMLMFRETDLEDKAGQMKGDLEKLFVDYLHKRQMIREFLAEKLSEPALSCEQARRMAGKLKMDRFLFGNVCDECGYAITRCGLSCF